MLLPRFGAPLASKPIIKELFDEPFSSRLPHCLLYATLQTEWLHGTGRARCWYANRVALLHTSLSNHVLFQPTRHNVFLLRAS